MRPSSFFTSRWMALAWAVLICLSAMTFVAGWSTQGNKLAPQQHAGEAGGQALNTAVAAN